MPVRTARANGAESRVRAHAKHVFTEQKSGMALIIRALGIDGARTKIGLANLIYNVKRLIVIERWTALSA